MPGIHPTAVVEPGAKLGADVSIGPYCVIGGDVTLGRGVTLMSHVVIAGRTRIGDDCRIFPFASIGQQPQDIKYAGEPSELLVGNNNVIREYVTMNPGTKGGEMVTRVGNNCLFLAGTHVAHDCQIGDNVIMVNNATLGGHVTVGDHAILGGLCAIHQYVRIGRHAMIGGMSGVEHDVIPYASVMGDRARLSGLNIVGLKRRKFSRDQIHNLRTAYRLLFAEEGTLGERLLDVSSMYKDEPAVMEIVDFINVDSNRSICQPKPGRAG